MKRFCQRHDKTGQATAELAIFGSVLIMVLAYLMMQGFIYNARQSLEMYTFREALRQSRSQQRAINLTVTRDVVTPSFFSGINKQRLMASASVEYNPWTIYIPDDPNDTSSRQLLQVGEAMIRKNIFFEIPPTHVRVETVGNRDNDEDDKWQWVSSAVSEMDSQAPPSKPTHKPKEKSEYQNITFRKETPSAITTTKSLASKDTRGMAITYESDGTVVQNYMDNNWVLPTDDEHILNVTVEPGTIPVKVDLTLEEDVSRQKTAFTPNP